MKIVAIHPDALVKHILDGISKARAEGKIPLRIEVTRDEWRALKQHLFGDVSVAIPADDPDRTRFEFYGLPVVVKE